MRSAKEAADYVDSDSLVTYTKVEIHPSGSLISNTKRMWKLKSLKNSSKLLIKCLARQDIKTVL